MANLNKTDKQEKNSTVFTPNLLSKHIFNIVSKEYDFKSLFDPCIGVNGGMTKHFKDSGVYIYGADIEKGAEKVCDTYFHQDIKASDIPMNVKPELIIFNPPFNGNGRGKNLLFPHLFLKTMFNRFGEDIPLVMITGDNFLNNNRKDSKRLKYISESNFEITSIMTLPLNIFDGILFNSQVLFFNMHRLKPFYIYNEEKVALNNTVYKNTEKEVA